MISVTFAHEVDETENYERHTLPSELSNQSHFISRMGDEEWTINPVDLNGGSLTVNEARTLQSELRRLINHAADLNSRRPRPVDPIDAAISMEIEACMGDLEWDVKEAAAEFGMTPAKLASRLRGHSSWTLLDVRRVATALSNGNDDVTQEIYARLSTLGLDA